jgi:hypothetical protein
MNHQDGRNHARLLPVRDAPHCVPVCLLVRGIPVIPFVIGMELIIMVTPLVMAL